MKIYVINTHTDFNKHYSLIEKLSSIGSTPDIHLIGMDTEMIHRKNYPESFETAKKWVINSSSDIIVCTIQIAIEDICFIIKMNDIGPDLPVGLKKMITSENWVKVGVNITNDLKQLCSNYNLGYYSGEIELMNICLLAKFQNPNLSNLYNTFFGEKLDKGNTIADWTKELDEKSINYAAMDASASYKIFNVIIKPSIDILKSKTTIPYQNVQINNVQINNVSQSDYISRLNCISDARNKEKPTYEINNINSEFICTCTYDGLTATGNGKSKKEAKHNSAENMFKQLKN